MNETLQGRGPRVVVIGAGISGLIAAHLLRQKGVAVHVLEKASQPGGAVGSLSCQGYLLEQGPNAFPLSHPQHREVLEALGLAEVLVSASAQARHRYLVKGGKPVAVPLSPWSAVRSPLLDWRSKCRVLCEPWVPRGTQEDETLAAFVRRRLGSEFLEQLIDPMVSGIHAGDPERLLVRLAFPKVWALESEHGSLIRGAVARLRERRRSWGGFKGSLVSFAGGMGELVRRLAEGLGEGLSCGADLQRVEPVQGQRWRVVWRENALAMTREEICDGVLCAVPAHALEGIPWGGGIGERLSPLATLPYASVAIVHLGFRREQVRHPLDGFGVLVPHREPCGILGALFSSALFPGRAPEGAVLLTVFVGGRRHPDDVALPEEALRARALSGVRSLLDVRGEPELVRVVRWAKAIPQYEAAHPGFMRLAEETEQAFPGFWLAGNWRHGIGVSHCLIGGREVADRAGEFLALKKKV